MLVLLLIIIILTQWKLKEIISVMNDISQNVSLYPLSTSYSVSIFPAGYSVAGGEFSGDDEEGEGHIYSTESQNTWLSTGCAQPPPQALSNI